MGLTNNEDDFINDERRDEWLSEKCYKCRMSLENCVCKDDVEKDEELE